MEVYCGKCTVRTPTINIVDRTFLWDKKYTGTCSVCGIKRLVYIEDNTLYTQDDTLYISTRKNYLDKDSVEKVEKIQHLSYN